MRIQWNNIRAHSNDMCHAVAGYFCPNCGSEIFAEWFYSRNCEWGIVDKTEYKSYQNIQLESREFASLSKCPFCNGVLCHSKEYFFQAYLTVCTKEKFFSVPQNIVSNTTIITDIARTDAEWNELLSVISNSETTLEALLSHYDKPIPISHPVVTNQIDLYSEISSTLTKEAKKKNIVLMNLDNLFAKLQVARLEVEQLEGKKLADEKSKQLLTCNNPLALTDDNRSKMVKTDSGKLQEYFLQIIDIEKNIISINQRLSFLYASRFEINRQAKFAQLYPIISEKKAISENIDKLQVEFRSVSKEISAFQRRRERICAETIIPPIVPFPSKPIEPIKPVYATANIFNKKKIDAENEAKAEKYNTEVDLYNKALAEYPVLIESAKKQQEELRAKAIKNREKEILAFDEQIKEKTAALENLKQEISAQQLALENRLSRLQSNTNYPAVKLKIKLDKEIALAEKLLSSLFKQKSKLYGTEIVFDKYRDLAAITSFYEYLLSGRCETLDGVNGCYNLYETEVRANIIINKLDAIGDSLEQIKGNQYMLYSQLSEINTELNALNATTTTMLNFIRDTSEVFLEHSAVIAYNSAVTAYYSKLNAEIASSDRYISMICF